MPPPSVLLVGLPWDHPEVAKQADPIAIRDGLVAAEAAIRGAGYAYDFFPIGPDDAPAKAALAAQLKERKYDGVVFGYGLRGVPELTVFFEEAVNLVKDALPGARLLFNFSPASTLDAVKRNFPL